MVISDRARELLVWLLFNPQSSLEEVVKKATGMRLTEKDLQVVLKVAQFESRVDPGVLGYNTRVRFEFNTQAVEAPAGQVADEMVKHVSSHPLDLAKKVYSDFYKEFGKDGLIYPLFATFGVKRDAAFEVIAKSHSEALQMRSFLQTHPNVTNWVMVLLSELK